jgi:DNA modification methylase
MDIKQIAIDKVIPYARNPRDNKEAISKVAASIKEYGFRQPIVVDEEMVIIAGHTRLLAAQQIGLSEVPVHIATDLSDVQIKAYRIADNKTHEFSQWDEELLALEMEELQKQGLDLDLTAFDSADIDHLLATLQSDTLVASEEHVPETPEEPITKAGDIWQLGNHRLICGDSTSADSYSKLLGDESVDMVFTDPPYNVDYQGTAGKIANDAMADAEFASFLQKAFCCMHNVMNTGAPFYVCYGDKEAVNFRTALTKAKLKISSCVIWKKNQFVLGRLDYQQMHEPILYGWKVGKTHTWHGGRNRRSIVETGETLPIEPIEKDKYQLIIDEKIYLLSGKNINIEEVAMSVVEIDKPLNNDLHPTMKPVALIEQFLTNSSKRNAIVLDCFGGSGSTLIACEKLGRKARLIELEPKFCDVIVKRWEEYSGGKAVLLNQDSKKKE